MTTGSISKISPISELTNVVQANAKTDASQNFSDVLKNSNKQADASSDTSKTADTVKTDDKTKVKKSEVTENRDDVSKADNKDVKKTSNADDENTKKEDTGIDEAVIDAATQMVQVVAQVLNIEPEAVTDGLENLGLDANALLDSANIPQVVVELTGAEDTLAIATDEDLFASVKEISAQADEFLSQLSEKLDMAKEDLKVAITEEPAIKQNPLDSLTNEITTETLNAEGPQIKVDRKDTGSAGDDSQAGNQMNWAQTVTEGIKAAAAQQAAEPETIYTPDMDRIYEQVTESLKLNMGEDVTEMEMSLHPASLGNVRIQVAARDGVVTANFLTQNEQVKAVLESQLVELKQSMNEQGIKVEAIEVSVAAHAFEENLSKEGDNSSEYEAREGRKRRSINLNEIDDSDDIDIDGDDEIRIAREMMMANGNSVDYMA
ncbi:MAG: flagellar hook-length control protein FliK [Lachnospiraceae bacterium]|nr:flagellar hook-length control protein FliK [Lachnospiraceae bacterium]